MSLEFEWDSNKAKANLADHGIDFPEALTVFADSLARIFKDEDHSEAEAREIIIGHSVKQRLVLVCFTARETGIRIISARKATGLERTDYEEHVGSQDHRRQDAQGVSLRLRSSPTESLCTRDVERCDRRCSRPRCCSGI